MSEEIRNDKTHDRLMKPIVFLGFVFLSLVSGKSYAASCEDTPWLSSCDTDNDGISAQLEGCMDGTENNPFDKVGQFHGIENGRYYYRSPADHLIAAEIDDAEGGGWALIAQYYSKFLVSTNLKLIQLNGSPTTAIELPTESTASLGQDGALNRDEWGHAGNATANEFTDATQLRFYGLSTRHGRVLHFQTTSGMSYVKSGLGSFAGIAEPTNTQMLTGHTASLPFAATQYWEDGGDYALGFAPFYTDSQQWNLDTYNRWEMDDRASDSTTRGSTMHKVWLRNPVSMPKCADTDNDGLQDNQDIDSDNDGVLDGDDANRTEVVIQNDDLSSTPIDMSTPANASITFNVLDNDDIEPGNNTQIERDTNTPGNAAGTVTFSNETGEMTYTPSPSESGLVTIGYSACHNASLPAGCGSAMVTVKVTDHVTFNIAATKPAEEAGEVNGEFTVSIDAPMSTDFSVPLILTGTAQDGADVQGMASAALIPAGQTSKTLVVDTIDDFHEEGPETVIYSINQSGMTPPENTTFSYVDTSATVIIVDDDVVPPAPPEFLLVTTDAATGVSQIEVLPGDADSSVKAKDADGNVINCVPASTGSKHVCDIPAGTKGPIELIAVDDLGSETSADEKVALPSITAPIPGKATQNSNNGKYSIPVTGVAVNTTPIVTDADGNQYKCQSTSDKTTATCSLPAGTKGPVLVSVIDANDNQIDAAEKTELPGVTPPIPGEATQNSKNGKYSIPVTGVAVNTTPIVTDADGNQYKCQSTSDKTTATCSLPAGTKGPVLVSVIDANDNQIDAAEKTELPGVTAPIPGEATQNSNNGKYSIPVTGVADNTTPIVTDAEGNQYKCQSTSDKTTATCSLPAGTKGPVLVSVIDANDNQIDAAEKTELPGVTPPIPGEATQNSKNGKYSIPVTGIAVSTTPIVTDAEGNQYKCQSTSDKTTATCSLPAGTKGPVLVSVIDANDNQIDAAEKTELPGAPVSEPVAGTVSVNPSTGEYILPMKGFVSGSRPFVTAADGRQYQCPVSGDGTEATCTMPADTRGPVLVSVMDPNGKQIDAKEKTELPAAPESEPFASEVIVNESTGEYIVLMKGILSGSRPFVTAADGRQYQCQASSDGTEAKCTMPADTRGPVLVSVMERNNGKQIDAKEKTELPAAPVSEPVAGTVSVNPSTGEYILPMKGFVSGSRPFVTAADGRQYQCPVSGDGTEATCTMPADTRGPVLVSVMDPNGKQIDANEKTELPAAPESEPFASEVIVNESTGEYIVLMKGVLSGSRPFVTAADGRQYQCQASSDGTEAKCTMPADTRGPVLVSVMERNNGKQIDAKEKTELPAAPVSEPVAGDAVLNSATGEYTVPMKGILPNGTPLITDADGKQYKCEKSASETEATCTLPAGTKGPVLVSAIDASGKQIDAENKTELPTVPAPVAGDATLNTDTGEYTVPVKGLVPGTTPMVTDANGKQYKCELSKDQTSAICNLPSGTKGPVLVSAIDASGKQIDAENKTELPTVPAPVAGDATLNTDTGEYTVPVKGLVPETTPMVTDANGKQYKCELSKDQTSAICNLPSGTKGPVLVSAIDASGKQIDAENKTELPTVPAPVAGDATLNTDTGEYTVPVKGLVPGTTPIVTDANGKQYKCELSKDQTSAICNLPSGTKGPVLVSAIDASGKQIDAADKTELPTVPAPIVGEPTLNKATGEYTVPVKGLVPGTTPIVTDANGKQYKCELSKDQTSAICNLPSGTKGPVVVGAIDASGKKIDAADKTELPTAPAPVAGNATLNTDTGEYTVPVKELVPGTTPIVTDANGKQYKCELSKDQTSAICNLPSGTKGPVLVSAIDASGKQIDAADKTELPTAPAPVAGNATLNTDTGEYTVPVKGLVPGTTPMVTDANGKQYKCELSKDQTSAICNLPSGTKGPVLVSAIDASGKQIDAADKTELPTVPAPIVGEPTLNKATGEYTVPVKGLVPGTTPMVTDANGKQYKCELSKDQTSAICNLPSGTQGPVLISAIDASGKQIDAENKTELPTVPAPVAGDATLNTDTGEYTVPVKGLVPGTTPIVTDANGKQYKCELSKDQTSAICNLPSGTKGPVLVSAIDASGKQIDAADKTELPTAPAPVAGNATLNTDTGEYTVPVKGLVPGTTPMVTDANGKQYKCEPSKDQTSAICNLPSGTKGPVLVSAIDASGKQIDANEKTELPTGPAPVVGEAILNPETGEITLPVTGVVPGSVVTVTDANGTVHTCAPSPATGTSVSCVLPAGTKGPVTVKATDPSGNEVVVDGTIQLPTLPTPVVGEATLNPETGETTLPVTGVVPGSVVTVTDANGTVHACAPSPATGTSVSCVLPAGTKGPVTVKATDPSGNEVVVDGTIQLPTLPAPVVGEASLNPETGETTLPVTGVVPGSVVTVTDANGTVHACAPSPATGTSVSCVLPAGTKGPVTVKATDPSGNEVVVDGTTQLPTLPAPVVGEASLNPETGEITLPVTGVVPGSVVTVIDANGTVHTCAPSPATGTSVGCVLPAGTKGPVTVKATDPSGNEVVVDGTIKLPTLPAPVVGEASLNPETGETTLPVTGVVPGSVVTVTDANGTVHTCAPSPATGTSVSCVLPAGTKGPVTVKATDPSGNEVVVDGTIKLPTLPAPVVGEASLNPETGETTLPVTGVVPGSVVTVTDANGTVHTCAPSPATGTSVSCVLPAGTKGPVTVSVTDPSGQTVVADGTFDLPITLSKEDEDGVSTEEEKKAGDMLKEIVGPDASGNMDINDAGSKSNVAILMDLPNPDSKGTSDKSPVMIEAQKNTSLGSQVCEQPKFTSVKTIQEGQSNIIGGRSSNRVTYNANTSAEYTFPHGLVEFQVECEDKNKGDGQAAVINLVFSGVNPDIPLEDYEIVKLTASGVYKPIDQVLGVKLIDSKTAMGSMPGKLLVITIEVRDDAADVDLMTSEGNGVMNILDPIGPALRSSAGGVTLNKTANKTAVTVGDMIQYSLVLEDTDQLENEALEIADFFPSGLSFISGSARAIVDSADANEHTVSVSGIESGDVVLSNIPVVPAGGKVTVTYLAQVDASASSGTYTNKARAGVQASLIFNGVLVATTNEAEASVVVGEDSVMDRMTVIGKVYNDINGDGIQDENERGLSGVKLITLTGLIITTDEDGRYSIPAVSSGVRDNGRNVFIKLDTNSLPEGYEMTTRNPLTQRVSKGLMSKMNFGVRQGANTQ